MRDYSASFSQGDYKILKREVLCEGIFRLVRFHLRHKLFDGELSHAFTRDRMERKSAVAVLPYDPKGDQVILIEQFRVGAINTPSSPWLLEVVAGVFDAEESSEEVARRETEEEAGCQILDLYPIGEFFVSPGGSNEYLYLFCAHIESTKEEGFFGLHEENEDIRTFVLSFETAYQWLEKGYIKTSPAMIALLWLKLNREWLQRLWLKK